MKEALGDKILSVAISGYYSVLTKGYDFAALNEYADIVTVLTYDYHGFWDGKASHHSPLKQISGDHESMNAEAALEYVASQGVAKSILHIGIPLYGQTFTLASNNKALGATTSGPGNPGPFTNQKGMLAYYEICKQGWQETPGSATHGPYANSGNQWVGYDDIAMVERKAQFALDNGYGGAALWSLDLDDFNNLCCHGPSPLANAASKILRGFSKVFSFKFRPKY